ncbi:MAG: RNA polymerase sigma-70 factor [Gemmatimonadaceae bacterium]
MHDLDLLDRIARGDRSAFETLFRSHYPALVGFAEGLLRSHQVAEDVVQDVMLNVWRQRETLRVEDCARAYLYRAVRNRAFNHLRHERVRRDAAPQLVRESPLAPSGDALLAEQELEAAVRAAVSELPERCREVFELSRVRGLRYTEIATTLGISVKTVETQMGRALKSLRESLAEYL